MSVAFHPKGPTPDPPPPDKIPTAERMADLADRLTHAIAVIAKWGIQVDASRLIDAKRLLRDVAAAKSFPESHDELVKIAHAARDAQEFAEISGMLPDEPIPPVATALRDATTDRTPKDSPLRPYQAQAELWVGAMLSCATDFVGSPLDHGRPDYVVRQGNMQYGIEVKRPQSADRILRGASKGSKQLRPWTDDYHGGALVMDLTDCLEPGLATTFHCGVPNLDLAQKWMGKQMRRLHRFVYDDSKKRIRNDHHHVFCVTVVTRSVHWDLDDLSQMYVSRYIGCLVYPKSPKSLRGIRATTLAELFGEGAHAAGYHDTGGHIIAFESTAR